MKLLKILGWSVLLTAGFWMALLFLVFMLGRIVPNEVVGSSVMLFGALPIATGLAFAGGYVCARQTRGGLPAGAAFAAVVSVVP
jgi:hypothetical protein